MEETINLLPIHADEKDSIILNNINRAIAQKIISLSDDYHKITYQGSRIFTATFRNPEEKVRASYFAELVLDYQYPQSQIDFEVLVPRRTPEDRADIVVFEDQDRKESYLVIECKKEGITDAEFKQAIEQAFGNANSLRAKYAAVVAGNTKTAFDVAGFKPNERERNVIADIPVKFGKAPKFKFRKGEQKSELRVVSREELISALEKCHDTVWQGGKLSPTTAFDEVSKLLFCKMKDEKDGTKKGELYKFQIGTHETATEVFQRVENIYKQAKLQDSEVFKEDIKLEAHVVYRVVEHLQSISLSRTDLDTKGVAFERFMTEYFKGKMGQFFTPRTVIDFTVKMLEPRYMDTVIDPSCGSGGFLLNVLDTVRKDAESSYDEKEAWDIWHKFAATNLYGIEINDQIARICKMNMIIHDDGHTNVISTDTLRPLSQITKIHKGFAPGSFSLLLANPPFGAVVKRVDKEPDFLDQYQLGKGRASQKTEILFIERCIEFMKPGSGRMGIVLPDGILTNSSLQPVRELLLAKCEVMAVISLPQFAFSHFGAGVKSSLVFARRKADDEQSGNYKIFMAVADRIGYDSTGSEDKSYLPVILESFKRYKANPSNFSVTSEWANKIFTVESVEIQNRLDPLFYSENTFALLGASKHKTYPIEKLAIHFKTGFAAGKAQQVENDQEGILQLRPTNVTEDGQLTFEKNIFVQKELVKGNDIVQKREVLFNNTNSQEWVGKSVFFDLEGDYTCSNHITRIKVDESLILPEYLWVVLNIYQKERVFYNLCTNWNNQSGVNIELLKSIHVPVPALEEQRKIVGLIQNAIKNKKALEAEAARIVNEAKNEVEQLIIGK